jgi:hypothetical protein
MVKAKVDSENKSLMAFLRFVETLFPVLTANPQLRRSFEILEK